MVQILRRLKALCLRALRWLFIPAVVCQAVGLAVAAAGVVTAAVGVALVATPIVQVGVQAIAIGSLMWWWATPWAFASLFLRAKARDEEEGVQEVAAAEQDGGHGEEEIIEV